MPRDDPENRIPDFGRGLPPREAGVMLHQEASEASPQAESPDSSSPGLLLGWTAPYGIDVPE